MILNVFRYDSINTFPTAPTAAPSDFVNIFGIINITWSPLKGETGLDYDAARCIGADQDDVIDAVSQFAYRYPNTTNGC